MQSDNKIWGQGIGWFCLVFCFFLVLFLFFFKVALKFRSGEEIAGGIGLAVERGMSYRIGEFRPCNLHML